MKVHVEFYCEDCDAEGDGFRDESEVGCSEDCWKCGGDNYRSSKAEENDYTEFRIK